MDEESGLDFGKDEFPYDYEDEFPFECGMSPDGVCNLAGSEDCDECPFTLEMIRAQSETVRMAKPASSDGRDSDKGKCKMLSEQFDTHESACISASRLSLQQNWFPNCKVLA